MKLHELKPDKGSTHRKKRVGLGHGAGQGKTAGRGTKGQGARRGGGKGPYFEGGQLPLVRRLPFKRGFNNIFRIEYQEVNVDMLQERFKSGETVTPKLLAERGLIRDVNDPIAVLGRGELSHKLTVQAHRFTKSAQEKIEGAGGTLETLELLVTGAHATVKKLRKEQLEALREERASGEQ